MATVEPAELKAIREKLRLTQGQLACALGVNRVSVARWEAGVRRIPPMLALAIKGLQTKRQKGAK